MDQRDEQAKPTTPKKYVSPRLVYLGAVRDLTAGSAGSAKESGVFPKNPGM
jgi:hypothetical protein